MKEFRDYDEKYPELVYDIVDYFRVGSGARKATDKSILDYCSSSRFSYKDPDKNMIQPDTVHLICENLTRKGVLHCTRLGVRTDGWDSNYIFMTENPKPFLEKSPTLVFRLNCLAYGFRYICQQYRKHVLPVVVKTKDGNIAMGTCFRFHTGILTAKHCLEGEEVSIEGYSADFLKRCPVLISNDSKLDMAYIEMNEPSNLVSDTAKVLDEVLVMGYPRIPMFSDFCAAERAAISSIPTKGAVAALADQYITPKAKEIMLITARIRGGNSGGPIIDSNGAVVGVAFSEPDSEGNYDKMGYGIAYPIELFYQMLSDYRTTTVNFVDKVC